MIPYIGDISKNDALLLKELAEKSMSILEFGPGASTQVMVAYTKGTIISVETEPSWIDRCRENLDSLKLPWSLPKVEFKNYYDFDYSGEYDFIFNDGADEFRLPFAIASWKHLKIGGYFAFHDTRRTQDIKRLCVFIEKYSPEIEFVFINRNHSNITVIRKKQAEFYEDWNLDEGRTIEDAGYNF